MNESRAFLELVDDIYNLELCRGNMSFIFTLLLRGMPNFILLICSSAFMRNES